MDRWQTPLATARPRKQPVPSSALPSSAPHLSDAVVGSLIKVILVTGACVGILDALGAITSFLLTGGTSSSQIFRYIASGAFGKAAFSGGPAMVAWGLFFHFLIAYAFTIFFFAIYPRVESLATNRLVTGLAYGLAVWGVMNFIVLPLSGTPKSPLRLVPAIRGAAIVMVCVGLPLALSAHRYYSRRRGQA